MNLRRHPQAPHTRTGGVPRPAVQLASLLALLLYSLPGICADACTVTINGNIDLSTITPGTASGGTTFTVSGSGAVSQTPASSAGGAVRSTASAVTPLTLSHSCTGGNGSTDKAKDVFLTLTFPQVGLTSQTDISSISFVSLTEPSGGAYKVAEGFTASSNVYTLQIGSTATWVWPLNIVLAFNFWVASTPNSLSGTQTATVSVSSDFTKP